MENVIEFSSPQNLVAFEKIHSLNEKGKGNGGEVKRVCSIQKGFFSLDIK